MNRKLAYEILELVGDTSPENLKKKYRMKALIYHPDKNKSPDACNKFREIHEAYEYLSNNKLTSQSYKEILMEFMNSIRNDEKVKPEFLYMIIDKITDKCEEKIVKIIKLFDKQVLLDIYNILRIYKDVMHIPESLITEIRSILVEKTKNDEIINLNPSINDLLNDNIYKLVIDERIYMIPLWHHEMIYDNSGNDLYIKCDPILPDNIEIDEYNNIHMNVNYKISDILGQDTILVMVGNRELEIKCSQLNIIRFQSIKLTGCGIPIIQPNHIYDVSRRGNIIINLYLE